MNEYDDRSSYQYHRGPLARPSARHYSSQYSSPRNHASYTHTPRYPLKSSHYVTSEAAEAIPTDAGYAYDGYDLAGGAFDSHYSHSRHGHPPTSEEIARQMREQERMGVVNPPVPSRHHRQGRTPGYVTSLDNAPSYPMPHSSLSSSNAYGVLPLDQNEAYMNPLYDQAMAYEDPYGGDGSSDGSSEASYQGYGRHGRHRQYPGQIRSTEYGREVFDGFEWVPEGDYRDVGPGQHSIARSGYRTPRPYRY